jgi:hypothetical protein
VLQTAALGSDEIRVHTLLCDHDFRFQKELRAKLLAGLGNRDRAGSILAVGLSTPLR